MLKNGYVALHRSICEWEWYKNSRTKDVFIHLILTANYEDNRFEGKLIKRGSRVASPQTLAYELGLTTQAIRTAIDHLKSTNEITTKSTNKYTVFTVVNYDTYQTAQQAKQQSNNNQTTNEQQSNNNNEIKKNKAIKNNKARKSTHHIHGDYNHVLLSDDEYSSLINTYGESKVQEYITRVDEYCEQSGKSYKNYSLTITNWIKKDTQKNGGQTKNPSYNLGNVEERLMNLNLNSLKV